MFAIPSIGSRIRITVSWADSLTAQQNRTTERTYIGVVVRNQSWEEPNTFSLATGVRYHPVSNIAIDRVIELAYVDSDKVPEMMTPQQIRTEYTKLPDEQWTVKGSKGDEYIIARRNNYYTCQCKGFGFRGKCGHIDEIKRIESVIYPTS